MIRPTVRSFWPLRVCALALVIGSQTNPAWAQFGSVVNIPPEPNIGDDQAMGGGTQVNLFGGGTIGRSFEVGSPSGGSKDAELNVLGGLVDDELHANEGGRVNLSAGQIGQGMIAGQNSALSVSGGRVGNQLQAVGSAVSISGGEVGNDFHAVGATLNMSGGKVGNDFHVLSNSEGLITGGTIGYYFHAGDTDGSSANVTVDMSGGVIRGEAEINNGAVFTMIGGLIGGANSLGGIDHNFGALASYHGGIFDYDFDTFAKSDVRIFGGDFFLDDQPLAATGQKIDIPVGSILSGVLADGTPFMLGDPLDDQIANQTLSLHPEAVPPSLPGTIHVPPEADPRSIRDGQTLILDNGGVVGDLFRAGRGSTVIMNGGQLGAGSAAIGAKVEIHGGQVRDDFAAEVGSTVDISGGTVGAFFDAGKNVQVNLSGGSVGTGFRALSGSVVNVTGGSVGAFFSVGPGATVNISGGSMGQNVDAMAEGSLNVFGGEFRLNGVLIADLETPGKTLAVNIPANGVVSGTLADGTPFALTRENLDFIRDGALTLHAAQVAAVGPATINLPGDTAPLGIRAGQAITVGAGGVLGDYNGTFNAGRGSSLAVSEGEVHARVEAVGASIAIAGGAVQGFAALEGTKVGVSGGSVGFGVDVQRSELSVSGGSVGSVELFDGASLKLTGGSILGSFGEHAIVMHAGSDLFVSSGAVSGRVIQSSTATIVGGSLTGAVIAGAQSETHLFGSEFLLGGQKMSGLALGVPYTVPDRDVALQATLLDGTPLDLDLNSNLKFNNDSFSPDAKLVITLLLPGDFDSSGKVDLSDFGTLKQHFGESAAGFAAGDSNMDGQINLTDFGILKSNFGGTAAAVPEPDSAMLAALGGLIVCLGLRSRRA
ncbi:MAG: hypothetical protein U0836_20250 [Pirellulales bacterium]